MEARLSGFHGRADLVAEVELADGQTTWIGVETKVDSNATREQLAATADAPNLGVLLTLGITAMNLTARDLGPDLNAWNVVTPADWTTVLRNAGAADSVLLAPYLHEVDQEASDHVHARELAHEPDRADWSRTSRRGLGESLEHYAWLAEIRDRLDLPETWWTYTNQSGPLMGTWRSEFQTSDRDTFLEFMCSRHRRILCLKIGEGEGDLLALAADACARIEGSDWQPSRRRPSKAAKTCTAGWLDLSALAPEAAAARTREAIAQVSVQR